MVVLSAWSTTMNKTDQNSSQFRTYILEWGNRQWKRKEVIIHCVNGDKSFEGKGFEDSLKRVAEVITFFPMNTESRIFEERTKEVRESSMEMARVETLQGDKSRLNLRPKAVKE